MHDVVAGATEPEDIEGPSIICVVGIQLLGFQSASLAGRGPLNATRFQTFIQDAAGIMPIAVYQLFHPLPTDPSHCLTNRGH